MAEIDFTAAILNLDGSNIIAAGPGGTNPKPMTLGMVATNALLSPTEDERNLPGDKKALRFDLALAIHAHQNGKKLDLASEQVAEIKNLIGKMYPPLVVGQALKLLEGKASGISPAPEPLAE